VERITPVSITPSTLIPQSLYKKLRELRVFHLGPMIMVDELLNAILNIDKDSSRGSFINPNAEDVHLLKTLQVISGSVRPLFDPILAHI